MNSKDKLTFDEIDAVLEAIKERLLNLDTITNQTEYDMIGSIVDVVEDELNLFDDDFDYLSDYSYDYFCDLETASHKLTHWLSKAHVNK